MLQHPETTTQSPTPHKKRGDPARIAPFGSSLTSRRKLVAWLGGCEYVALTTTDSVWISSRGSMVGLFSLSCFARHVPARCIPRREAC